jgi:hypothetical protein
MATTEQDVRLNLLNTLLTTPHRKLDEVWPVHREMVAADPRFYVRLAAWYADNGEVRDHKEMFVVTLALSDFPGHRDAGLAMLRQLPPYQLVRVLDFVSGRKTTRKVRDKVAAKAVAKVAAKVTTPTTKRERLTKKALRALRKALAGSASVTTAQAVVPAQVATQAQVRAAVPVKTVTESFGLFRNVPRSLRTEIVRYLREREADADWFDGTVLVARKAVKRLYALNHVKPTERAQRILFDEEPPADSRIYALRRLAKATSPAEQATAIIENAIPYRVAATVVKQMTPTVLLALIDRMSPQELINNVASLQRRGAFDNAELKAQIEQKLEQAKTGPRVSAFKAERAKDAGGDAIGADVRAKLEQVADARVKAKGRIARPTALLIDKSASMSASIEVGKRIGAMISAVCEQALYVYAFDTMAYPVSVPFDDAQGRAASDLASWARALAGINAAGGTSIGASIEVMRIKNQYVEQIIVVTDEEENTAPMFVDALAKYRTAVKAEPTVCIVRIGASSILHDRCTKAGVAADVFRFGGDYYSLPNLVPLLSKPSKLELLTEIMDYPLPQRRSA